jgi:hypothetical protein
MQMPPPSNQNEAAVEHDGCCDGRTFDIMTILFGFIHSFGVKIEPDLVLLIRIMMAAYDSSAELIIFSIQNSEFFAADSSDEFLFAACFLCVIAHWIYFFSSTVLYDTWNGKTITTKIGLKITGLIFDVFMLGYAGHMFTEHDDTGFNLALIIIESLELGLDCLQLIRLIYKRCNVNPATVSPQ